MAKNPMDIYDSLNYLNVLDAEQLYVIIKDALKLTTSMKKLRNTYKAAGKLPLSIYHDDYHNMQLVSELIEEEALKFNVPCYVKKEYIKMNKKYIEEIKKDPLSLMESGLDEWLDEGLI